MVSGHLLSPGNTCWRVLVGTAGLLAAPSFSKMGYRGGWVRLGFGVRLDHRSPGIPETWIIIFTTPRILGLSMAGVGPSIAGVRALKTLCFEGPDS